MLAFNSDGTRLASAGQDLTVRLWNLDRREELGEPVLLSTIASPAFVPGASQLAVAGQGLWLWPMDPAASRRTACGILGDRRLDPTEIEQYLRGAPPVASC